MDKSDAPNAAATTRGAIRSKDLAPELAVRRLFTRWATVFQLSPKKTCRASRVSLRLEARSRTRKARAKTNREADLIMSTIRSDGCDSLRRKRRQDGFYRGARNGVGSCPARMRFTCHLISGGRFLPGWERDPRGCVCARGSDAVRDSTLASSAFSRAWARAFATRMGADETGLLGRV